MKMSTNLHKRTIFNYYGDAGGRGITRFGFGRGTRIQDLKFAQTIVLTITSSTCTMYNRPYNSTHQIHQIRSI